MAAEITSGLFSMVIFVEAAENSVATEITPSLVLAAST
jgi:hypothetical protein